MKIFAVYDTNILVSGRLSKHPDSAVVLTLDALLNQEVTPLYNQEILNEYRDVLHREKFKLPKDLVDSVVNQIEKDGLQADRVHTDEVITDPDDVVFYEVALSKEDAFLVTGNSKHFPQKPIVVSPAEFLKIFGKL